MYAFIFCEEAYAFLNFPSWNLANKSGRHPGFVRIFFGFVPGFLRDIVETLVET